MKKLCAACLAALAAIGAARADLPAGWSTNYAAAFSEAAAGQRPVVVYFGASWCGPCKMMSRVTLTNALVVQALSGIPHVAIDVDEQRELAEQHAVDTVPTLLVLSAGGEEVRRASGFQPPEALQAWLAGSFAAAKEAAVRQAARTNQLVRVDRWLADTNAAALSQAATALFDLCAARSPGGVQQAAARLQTLAAREPALLLPGLRDPRLATRIRVVNALRARLGEAFDVDPWAEPATRDKAVETWRRKLAPHPDRAGD